MFRKSDTQSSVTAAVHQRAFGRRMTSKYLKLQIHLAVGWQLWRKEGSLGRNRAGMIQGQLAERAEQAIIQKSETRLVRVVITALENRLVLLWQSSQGYWWAGGSSSQKPILPSLTVGATGLTPAPALSQLPFPPPPPYFSWEQQLNPPLLSSSPRTSQQQNRSSPQLWKTLSWLRMQCKGDNPPSTGGVQHTGNASLFSWQVTLKLLNAIFYNPKDMLAAAAVLKQGTWSYTTDIRESFATALNGDSLKVYAFKKDYALLL